MTTTRRRGFVAALGMAGVALVLAAGADAKQTLRISTPAVPDDWHTKMLYVFKEHVDKAAPEAFDIQIHHSGTLFKQGTEPAAMARGNLEMALISMQDISKQVPEYSLFTAGYLIRDPDHQQKVFTGPIGREIYGKVSDVMDIQVLQVAYLGTRQVNLRDLRAVKTPDDLKGVKLRMPGSKEWLFLGEALGANPTPLAFNEVYLALKTGTIDGQDNPLPTVRSAKFYEVTKQLVLTNHMVDGVFLAIAKKAWMATPPAHQKLLQEAALAGAKFNNENRIKDEQGLVEFFRREGLAVTVPDVEAFRARVQKAYLESEFSKDWPKGMIERVNATK
ncbi:MAG: sialic acid TRAP transporter substrate-binding protein SiaP [Pseudomonadota bacterium]